MSVTQYTIGCGYELLKLKDTVFFISKNRFKTVIIDNGDAYATFVNQSPYPPSPNRLKGFNVKLTETESLDERYKFTKQLTMSIHGHLTDSQFLMDDDYYIVVQTEDGTYYLVNVDFPSKMTYTYNLSEGQNQTDFTFTSNSNHPTLKLNWNPTTWNTCQTYQVYGIDGLKLLEKDYTTIDAEQGVINLFDGNEFKDVDFLKNTISLQEAYDGNITTTTISFEIPFNNYKPSWQYNLLEFDQNLYTAHITPKNSESGIFAGYEHGLQPSYEINGSTSDGESTSIKITLVEASNWGIFEFDTWSYYRDSTKTWVGIDGEVKCIGLGIGIHTLMEEVDANGTPTGRYKCLDGYESEYTNYNIVGTYTEDDVESFRTSVCTRFKARAAAPTGYYTCINGDKYELIGDQTSYDGGKHWIVDSYELGQMVESGSSWCEIEPQYKWEVSDEWECISMFERWIPSGTTCINGNKYQNNYLEISYDNEHWESTDPLEWSASTLIESASTDCIIYRWTPSGYTCVGYDKYRNNIKEISVDGGQTWTVVIPTEYSASTLIETNSEYCGYVSPFKIKLDYYYTSNFDSYTVACNSSSTITQKEVRVQNRSFVQISGVTIGSCATSIGNDAFDSCYKLKQLVIPSNITSIGEWFINSCTGLTYIIFEGTVPPTAAYGAFETEYSINCPIYVPCGSLETYKTAPEYRKVANRIQCMPPKYTIGLNGGVTSSGNCNGNDTIYGQSYEYNNPQDVLSLETGLCVKNISDSAFKNCNNMTALTLSETVENIGENAFENINVNYLKIPRCVKTIHSKAFNNSNIQTIKCFATVPPTLYEDDGDVFNYSNIQTVYVYIAVVDRYKAAAGWSKFGGKIVGMTNTN